MSLDFTDSSHWYQLRIFVIILNMLQYSIFFYGFFLTLVGLCLMTNVLKEACEVNDIMLLFVTNNCWNQVTYTRILTFLFSSVYDSDEDKNVYRKNILSSEYVSCLSTINHILDGQLVNVGSCIILHQVVVTRSTKVRHMNLFLFLKSVLTYESHT